jgi:histidinol phosphatase-like enzyme
MLKDKIIIAVDFDGTITNERDMEETVTLRKGAKETLTEWKAKGYILVLWTCRHGKSFDQAINFLIKNDMLYLFSAFNDQLPEINELYYPDVARKVGADFYVDDRNVMMVMDWKLIDYCLRERIKELKGE